MTVSNNPLNSIYLIYNNTEKKLGQALVPEMKI